MENLVTFNNITEFKAATANLKIHIKFCNEYYIPVAKTDVVRIAAKIKKGGFKFTGCLEVFGINANLIMNK